MQFHLWAILSVATRFLLADSFQDVKKLLPYMTNDACFTHQAGRMADECKPYLIDQMPWLKEVESQAEAYPVNQETAYAFRELMLERYGAYHEVQPIPMDDHDVIDPITELESMVDPGKIISINLTDEEPPSDVGDINWKVD